MKKIAIVGTDKINTRRLAGILHNDATIIYECHDLRSFYHVIKNYRLDLIINDSTLATVQLHNWLLKVRYEYPTDPFKIMVLVDTDELSAIQAMVRDEHTIFVTRPILPSDLVKQVNEVLCQSSDSETAIRY